MKHSNITFTGRSGTQYHFEAWPLETRFAPSAAVFVVTRRAQESSTYNRASHEIIYIGQTANLADPFATEAQFECFRKHGANCICVHVAADEARRARMEEDLATRHEAHCNQKRRAERLFDVTP